MASLGNRLRQQRLARGVELSAIAAETRIGVRYLEALENEDLAVLPGDIFARSFARQYARFIGIDDVEIEDLVRECFQPEEHTPVLDSPAPPGPIHVEPIPELASVSGRKFPWPMVGLAAALVACTGLYIGWQKVQDAWLASDSQASAPVPPEKNTVTPAQPTSLSEAPHPSPDVQTVAVELPVPAAGSNGMLVKLVASEKTWVSISANGKVVFSGILQPNEVRNLAGVERARMVVGNAGGLEVLTDGKSIGPIGPPGQVRVVLITPEGPQIIRRPPSDHPNESSDSGAH